MKHFFCLNIIMISMAVCSFFFYGCKQSATILRPEDTQLVGSHKAGSEVFKPLVDEAVGKLLAAEIQRSAEISGMMAQEPKRICFVGVENYMAEELVDFKEQLYEMIDSSISAGGAFTSISRRYIDPALREQRLRIDELTIPKNQRSLQFALERANQPFSHLLFARLTSGTTVDNKDYQRDYKLTLELININDGSSIKESCDLSKAYNVSAGAKVKHSKFNPHMWGR